MQRVTYAMGRVFARGGWWSYVGLAVAVGASAYGVAELSALHERRAAQQQADELARKQREAEDADRAQKAAHARLVEECRAPAGARYQRAIAAMDAKDPEAAADAMTMCGPVLEPGPAKQLHIKAFDAARAKRQAEFLAAVAREKAARKAAGVSIGMSQEDVLASSWGRPMRINRDTTARGVREQWVYSNGGYLYFENGILRTIQETR